MVKCGEPRVLILREIRRGRADINLNHVRQPSPSRVSHQKARVLEEIKSIQEPTQSRVSYLKARALEQVVNKPTRLKPINPQQQASTQHQFQVSSITSKSTSSRKEGMTSRKPQSGSEDMTKTEHGTSRPPIKDEKEASWADKENAAKMFKGAAERDQMVLETPRAEADEESIVEMVRQMNQQFVSLTREFKASMAEFDKQLAKARKTAAE